MVIPWQIPTLGIDDTINSERSFKKRGLTFLQMFQRENNTLENQMKKTIKANCSFY